MSHRTIGLPTCPDVGVTVMAVAEEFHLDFPIDTTDMAVACRSVFILLLRLLYHKTARFAIANLAV